MEKNIIEMFFFIFLELASMDLYFSLGVSISLSQHQHQHQYTVLVDCRVCVAWVFQSNGMVAEKEVRFENK